MRILAIISGEYGRRHADNVRTHGPKDWEVMEWEAPSVLPPVIDYPEDYLPESLPAADLMLSFAEHKGVAELLPEIAKMTGAQAVLAAVDNEAWLPRGLARQLHGWLAQDGVACATPKPLCSLREGEYDMARGKKATFDHPYLLEFARYFGQPSLDIQVDGKGGTITGVRVVRDAVCGCARFTAEGLIGISVQEAEEKAGLLHHHYPCLASMGIDVDYHDTLMHVSGNLLKDEVGRGVRPFKEVRYITPGGRSENPSGEEA